MEKKKGVILLSGGLDSATTAAIAIDGGFNLSALSFRYGQKHDVEAEYSEKLADFFKITDHRYIDIPSGIFRSALVKGSEIDVPDSKDFNGDDIPVTYVPGRNILFLSYALSYAESIDARHIFIGANAVDYSGYPDCRPEFFKAFQEMANIGTKKGVEGGGFIIETPLISFKKSEIIKLGLSLGVDYSITHSCYNPDLKGHACGICDSCVLRKNGFNEADVDDPTLYSS